MSLTGYLHPDYAAALAEFGTPVLLPRSGGWLLKRPIPGSHLIDGLGCYPYLCCKDWPALGADLDELKGELVSFAAAPDPFGAFTPDDLRRIFPDTCVHFKDHYVADLSSDPDQIISKHHRKYARKALRELEVEFHERPVGFLDEWVTLFDEAVRRFAITGVRAFSRESFARQFALPGTVMSLACHGGTICAAHVWMMHGDTVYAHIAAATAEGRALGSAYALYDAEIRYYTGKVRWIDWGGEAGVSAGSGALGSFKQGWSNATRPAYFCGRIFDRAQYNKLIQARGLAATTYFPAYRQGEFG